MQRTTTTAVLLASVAVAAVSGCVSVERPGAAQGTGAAQGSESASPASPAPRSAGRTPSDATQAPARERLQWPEPVGGHLREASPTPGGAGSGPSAPPRAAADDATGSVRDGAAGSVRPKRPHPAPQRHRPKPKPPQGPPPHARGHVDLCALGRQHGRWRRDSPEAVICQEVYGR
ncbi:hypothetical protein [Streptomyces sp. NPDC059063]|uniref:hypothetical protein n=1 Tax=unclassified Streptomyces TaxID=2593676 RepID=UPI003696EAE8